MRAALQNAKAALNPLRRRVNQLLGRDLPYGVEIRCDTLRLGTTYGGWTVRPSRIGRDSIVYCVGVGTDISFDLEMIRRFGVTLHAFDPTPKSVQWIETQQLPPQFAFHPIGLAAYDGVARFTLPRPDYVSYHITQDGGNQQMVECPVRRLKTIMADLGHDRIDVLKIDIEGAEYAVIDDLLRSGIAVEQLLVEFHHTVGDRATLAKTRAAVEALHTAGYRIFAIAPLGLEYSFAKIP